MAVVRTDPFDFRAPFPLDLRNRRADLNGRNSIEINARWPGMLVWVDSERVLYLLDAGEGDKGDNDRWRQVYPATDIDRQNVTFLTDTEPTGGADGDISFVDNTGDSVVQVWYRVAGVWAMLGQWSYGGVPPIHERPGVDFQTTSAALNGWYPDAVEGEVVWGEDGSDVWVFTKRGSNWSVRQEQIA